MDSLRRQVAGAKRKLLRFPSIMFSSDSEKPRITRGGTCVNESSPADDIRQTEQTIHKYHPPLLTNIIYT
jgi:hypothetical protein